MTRIEIPATKKASTGESTAGLITLLTSACHLTPELPTAASSAPTTPPISACDELEGSPKYHVMRFHTMAPASPAKAIVSVTLPAETIPPATVAATLSEMKAPAKFSTEAIAMAARGESARVEMEEATTLAVSWKPLVKSKASAVRTTMTRSSVLCIFPGLPGLRLWVYLGSGRNAGALRQRPFHQLTVSGTLAAAPSDPLPVAIERPREGVVGQAALEGIDELGPKLGGAHGHQQFH